MATIEERVEALETWQKEINDFIGTKEKILAYANTIEDICNKYLTVLYFEDAQKSNPEVLYINGYLGTMADDKIQVNRLITVKANHAVVPDSEGKTSVTFYNANIGEINLPLMKFNSSGTLSYLSEGDYALGDMVTLYVNTDQKAILSVSDKGNTALDLAKKVEESLDTLSTKVSNFSSSFTTENLIAKSTAQLNGNITLGNVSKINSITIPKNTTTEDPTVPSGIANKNYVDNTIDEKILTAVTDYLNGGTEDASEALADKPDHAIYLKY